MIPSLRIMTRASARALAVCLTAALVPTTVGCGAKTLDVTSTDTGNPPVVDIDKVSSVVGGDTVIVSGEKGAATPGGAEVTVTNQRTGTVASVTANQDGSFTLEIGGAPGDTLELEVAGGKSTEQIHVATATMPPILVTPEKHRAAPEVCDEVRPAVRPSPDGEPSDPAELCSVPEVERCCYDEDCTNGTRGRCSRDQGSSYCAYDLCQEDSDCTTSGPCYCSEEGNRCVDGNCRIDGDCSGGAHCSPSFSACGRGVVVGYFCHTADDECTNDSDCTTEGLGYCMYSSDMGHWLCGYTNCPG